MIQAAHVAPAASRCYAVCFLLRPRKRVLRLVECNPAGGGLWAVQWPPKRPIRRGQAEKH